MNITIRGGEATVTLHKSDINALDKVAVLCKDLIARLQTSDLPEGALDGIAQTMVGVVTMRKHLVPPESTEANAGD